MNYDDLDVEAGGPLPKPPILRPMTVNRKHMSSLFTMLFSDPDLLRELYCALMDVDLPPGVPVIVNTLTNLLFIDRINDISFEVDGRLIVLIEHQSTINPNLPLRILFYASRIYERRLGRKNLFSRTPIKIPRMEFYVLYNGKEDYPRTALLRLSDMVADTEPLGLFARETGIEIVVKVFNINEGQNPEIAARSKALAGYIAFVAKVREGEKAGLSMEEAVKLAIRHCRNHDGLKGFFEERSEEVLDMMLEELTMDDYIKISYDEGWEGGWQGGEARGLEMGEARGLEIGEAKGLEMGEAKGLEITARNAITKGYTSEQVHEITGLDMEIIAALETEVFAWPRV